MAEKFGHKFAVLNSTKKLDEVYDVKKKKMGEGSYGFVSKATHKDIGATRAVKCIDKSKVPDEERFKSEVEIHASLDHPHIVKLFEVFEDSKNYYLVMELCTGGELFDRIVAEAEKREDGLAFTEAGAATYMTQILGAMSYLHSNNFVHRDIKPENFLMQNEDDNAAIKVIDFGLAKKFTVGSSERMKTKAGTPYYVSPQVLQGSYNEKCDVWSCGVIAYILLCGYPPFYGDTDSDILKMVKKGKFDFPEEDWSTVSDAAKDFIQQMMKIQDSDRPSAGHMLDHAWIKDKAVRKTGTISKDLCTRMKKFTGATKMKKLTLTMVAQSLKDEDIKELRQMFEQLDENNDGTLTVKEIQESLAKYEAVIPADLVEIIRNLDTDGSGSIDYSEFIAATLTQKQYLKKEVVWSVFRQFDKDGDGTITKQELAQVLQVQEGGIGQELVDSMMKEVDTDGDGKISYDEFCVMMEARDT
eukprot:TRINITY_DN103304_c0_g1_i1.p1 TRINITY_DN103304_c0_g1~~TRINITY_DN103304_c0_g1_i1.p1  ORF type:complete len:471 (+),score=104.17 TRINITY_DN103304_c0_g1_i1:132-1544(+)